MAEWIIEIKDGKFPIGKWTELVRCKDCKFWDKESDGERRYCAASGSYWRADEYCSDGERREDGTASK